MVHNRKLPAVLLTDQTQAVSSCSVLHRGRHTMFWQCFVSKWSCSCCMSTLFSAKLMKGVTFKVLSQCRAVCERA